MNRSDNWYEQQESPRSVREDGLAVLLGLRPPVLMSPVFPDRSAPFIPSRVGWLARRNRSPHHGKITTRINGGTFRVNVPHLTISTGEYRTQMADASVGELKDAFPDEKTDAIWTRFILRPLSFPLALLFFRLGFSANQVTYLSIGTVFAGASLFVLDSYLLAVAGSLLFNVFALLDCVDGNIARITKSANPYGAWVDALGGYLAYTLLFLSVGVFVEETYETFWLFQSVDFVLVGAISATANLLMRIQHQKFENVRGSTSNNSSSSDSLQKQVSRNVGITGFLMPAVFVAAVVSVLNLLLIGYALFYTFAWIVVSGRQISRIERLDPPE